MATEPYDQDDTDESQPAGQTGGSENPRWRQDLERRAVDGDRAREELATAQDAANTARKEVALLKLGIDPESKQGQLLVRVHGDGDPSVDALRATADQYDLLPKTQATPENAAAAQRMAEVGQGGQTGSGVSDWETELAKVPQYGQPGWEQGKQRALDLLRQHGGMVTEDRPKTIKMFDTNGRPIGQHSAVSPRY